jgi:hypothetical protein
MKVLHKKWHGLIALFVKEGGVGIRVNDDINHHFQIIRFLRQGDPHSQIILLFWQIC